MVRKIKLKCPFEMSVSQKEKQTKPVAGAAGCTGRPVVNSSWVAGRQSTVACSVIGCLLRNQNLHCAHSKVAGIWYFGKGGHFGEGSPKRRSTSPLLKTLDPRFFNQS